MKTIKKILPEETYNIRKEVLRAGVNLPFKFQGDFDTKTFHLGAFNKEVLVGVATFIKQNCNLLSGTHYQLRGMATLPEVRGKGFGNLLIDSAVQEIEDRNIDVLWCNAREVAQKFYQKNGFKTIGKPFEVDQIGTHYIMYKPLK